MAGAAAPVVDVETAESATEAHASRPVAVPLADARSETGRPRRSLRRVVVFVVLAAVVAGAATFGCRWWQNGQRYVATDNAQLAGRLVQVGAPAAGRVADVRVDVGQRVVRDQVVAHVYVPVPVGVTASGQPRLEFRETEDALVEVTAPADGVVVARAASPGDSVPVGQPLLTLANPEQLWVTANVEETQVGRLAVGQPVEVHVDALDADLSGHVQAITPASAATFSLLPSSNTSGNFTKQTQLVPIKVALDQPEPRLSIGTSVEVRILVQP